MIKQGAKMALNKLCIYLPLVALPLAVPSLCRAGAITVNGICEFGDCASPQILPYNGSAGQSFSFLYTFPNTDSFRVHGSYSASSSSSGTEIAFTVHSHYVGNSTHTRSSGDDVLTVDLLQNYRFPFDLDGTYSYSDSLTIGIFAAAGSSIQTDLFYDGQDVGTIGPFTGAGTHSGSASADLTGLTHPLAADYRYTITFTAGSLAVPDSPGVPDTSAIGDDPRSVGGVGSAISVLQRGNHE